MIKKIVQIQLPSKCINQDCDNKLSEGEFVMVRIGNFSLFPVCKPCANYLAKIIDKE